MEFQMIFSFLIYFSILIGIGLAASRSTKLVAQKGNASFILGGRSLNYWVTAISAHASDMGNWIFMAFPALIYVGGLFNCWIAVGLITGMFLNWHFIAPKLRRMTQELDCYTLASFFERRFADKSGIIRLMTALMSLLFFVIYISAGLVGVGLLCKSVFGMNYYFGVLACILVMVVYTYAGGFVAVAWVDLFQGFFLLAMILLVPAVVLNHLGGILPIIEAANMKNISLSLFPDLSLTSFMNAIQLSLGWGLGYFGMPHILNKFMGISNADEMYKSKYVGMVWQVLILFAAMAVGLVGIAYFPEGLANNQLIFVVMVKDFFTPFFAGFVLCGILAAILSTIDSQILVVAGIIAEDVYPQLVRKKVASQETLRVYRSSILCISALAAGIALAKVSTIYHLVWYAWTGLGCSFGPVVITALYSKRVNRHGALAGIVTGGILAAIWKPLLNPLLFTSEIPGMIPGFFGSLLSIYLVSYLTKSE